MCGWYAREIDNGRKNKRDMEKMQNHFSSEVPNPYNYPKCFWYYLQLYKIDVNEGRTHR